MPVLISSFSEFPPVGALWPLILALQKVGIYITHIFDVLVIKLKFLAGKLAEVSYLCQFAEDWILLAEWHLLKHVHILHNINPTIKYIHTLCLRMLVEQWQLEVHNTHLANRHVGL